VILIYGGILHKFDQIYRWPMVMIYRAWASESMNLLNLVLLRVLSSVHIADSQGFWTSLSSQSRLGGETEVVSFFGSLNFGLIYFVHITQRTFIFYILHTVIDYKLWFKFVAYITSRFRSLSIKSKWFVIYILDAYYDQSVSPHMQNSSSRQSLSIRADAYVMSLLNVSPFTDAELPQQPVLLYHKWDWLPI
jgi:hypothetical protein